MALSTDSRGYTVIAPSADSRVIYVSSTDGNDANDGLDPGRAKRTIAAGKALLRDGFPDHLCFKRGDVWTNEQYGAIKISGRSATEPIVIRSYGTSPLRPRWVCSGAPFSKNNGGGVGLTVLSHFWITDIHAVPNAPGVEGVNWIDQGSGIVFEDCLFDGFQDCLVLQGGATTPITNPKVRRCALINSTRLPPGNRGQGMFLYECTGAVVEECFFDHNGWVNADRSDANIFGHNVYQSEYGGSLTFRNNISVRPSSHGVQIRTGGTATGNIFDSCPIGILIGGGDVPVAGGVSGTVTDNIIVNAADINGLETRGQGIMLTNVSAAGAVCTRNIIANSKSSTTGGYAIEINAGSGVGVRNCAVSANLIVNWRGPVQNIPGATSSGHTFTGNTVVHTVNESGIPLVKITAPHGITFTSNAYYHAGPSSAWFNVGGVDRSYAQWVTDTGETGSTNTPVSFPDAVRDLAAYNATLGGPATIEAFSQRIRQHWKGNYDARLAPQAIHAWLNAGFTTTTQDPTDPNYTPPLGAPNAPGVITVTVTTTPTGSQANLSWSAVSGADSYSLYSGHNHLGPYTLSQAGITSTSVTVPLSTSSVYFVLTARNDNGESGPSPEAKATGVGPPPPLPSVPQQVLTEAVSNGFDVTWSIQPVGTNVEVVYGPVQGGPYPFSTTSNTGTAQIRGLRGNTRFFVRARGVDANGASQYSPESTIDTLPGIIPGEPGTPPTAPPVPPVNPGSNIYGVSLMAKFRDSIQAIADRGGRLLVDMSGDSTLRYEGHGHCMAVQATLDGYFPNIGVLIGANGAFPSIDGGFFRTRRRGTATKGATSSLPSGCNEGIVVPAGWEGFLPCYYAAGTSSTDLIMSAMLAYDSPIGNRSRFSYAVFFQEINEANGATRSASGFEMGCWRMADFQPVTAFGTEIVSAARVNTATTGTTGTLRAAFLEVPEYDRGAVAATQGLAFSYDAKGTGLVGPAAVLYHAVVNKTKKSGFIHTIDLVLGGNSLDNLIKSRGATQYSKESLKTKMQCFRMLCATSYADAYPAAAAYGQPTTGGPGGNGSAYYAAFVCEGHNDSADGDIAFCQPSIGQSVQYQQAVTAINRGGGTLNVADATQLPTAGMLGFLDALNSPIEWITWTGKSGNQLTGCTFTRYGSAAASGSTGTAYVGYPASHPKGFAANLTQDYQFRLAAWIDAGGSEATFIYVWVTPIPCSDTPTNTGSSATFAGRQYIFDQYRLEGFRLEALLPGFVVADLSSVVSFGNVLEWGAPNVTSTTSTTVTADGGTTLTLSSAAAWGTSGETGKVGSEYFSWTGKSGNQLTGLSRGLYGSTSQTWPSGTDAKSLDFIHHSWTGFYRSWLKYLNTQFTNRGGTIDRARR